MLSWMGDISEEICRQWREELGVDARPLILGRGEVIDRVRESRYEALCTALTSSLLSPALGLGRQFVQVDPALEELFDKQSKVLTMDEYLEISGKIDDRCVRSAHIIPLEYTRRYYIRKPWITGLKLDTYGEVAFNEVVVGPKPP
jgi:hypothetical protein